jgi:hypothetical protein
MERIVATTILRFGPGTVLGLSETQAAARSHALAPAGAEGAYRVTSAVEFKVGEEIGVAEAAPKDPAGNAQAVKPAKGKKAEAEAS